MLEISHLTAGYGGRPVLEDITLTIPQGKLTVILGPNGSGKSTLLKALAGILPAQGAVCLEGENLLALPAKDRARRIAYLPQNRQVPEITARRLVLHGRFPYLGFPRRYRQEDLAAAEAAMARMDIASLADRPLATLSGGQRQKVYIAMALAQQTPVILLDEPNTFLDISHQLQWMETAQALAQEGKTVVLVLHDLTLALESGAYFVAMDQGRAAFQGTSRELLEGTVLKDLFGIALTPIQTPWGTKYYYGR